MISLELPYPPTVNTYYRQFRGKTLISEKGRAYRLAVVRLLQTKRFKKLGKARVRMLVEVYPPDARRRDLDNIFKALCDALAYAGVYEDDGQIDDLRVIRKDKWGGGMVLVHVEPI